MKRFPKTVFIAAALGFGLMAGAVGGGSLDAAPALADSIHKTDPDVGFRNLGAPHAAGAMLADSIHKTDPDVG